jgi:hypothetical protein
MERKAKNRKTSNEFVELENASQEMTEPISFKTNIELNPINTLKEEGVAKEEDEASIKESKHSVFKQQTEVEANNLVTDSEANKENVLAFPQLDILKKELEIKTLKTNLVVVSFLEGLFISSNLVFFFIYTKVFEISLPHYSMWDMCIFGLQILNPLYGYTIDSNFLFKGSKSKTLILISVLGNRLNWKACCFTVAAR